MRLTIPTGLLLLLCACSCGDDGSPTIDLPEQETDPPDTTVYEIHDLHLDATVSTAAIVRGDTMEITLIARNPQSGIVRASFPSTCQETYWVYDDSGQYLGPGCGGFAMPTRFEMMPGEERQYHLSWRVCPVSPGSYTLVVGFASSYLQPRHAADPHGGDLRLFGPAGDRLCLDRAQVGPVDGVETDAHGQEAPSGGQGMTRNVGLLVLVCASSIRLV